MSINNIEDIENLLKLEKGTLSSAISNEEGVDITIPSLKVFTEDDHNTLLNNQKALNKTAGREIAIKETRDALGLDFTGKTMDNLMTAYKVKIEGESSTEPNEKIKALQADKEALQKNVEEWSGKFTGLQNDYTQEKERQSINELITNKLMAKGEYNVPTKDAVTLFKSNHSFEKQEGVLVFKDGMGEVMKDELTTPVSIDHMIDQWAPNYLKQNTGGRGAADETGAGETTSMEAFDKRMKDQGVNGTAYNERMNQEINAGTLKI